MNPLERLHGTRPTGEWQGKPFGQQILYMTDTFKVSQGYEPAFAKLLGQSGITRRTVVLSDIYSMVSEPLTKKGNEKLWRFNLAKLEELRAAFAVRVQTINPCLIVVSCPALIGVLVGGDLRLGTLDKCRGGVYEFMGRKVIVTVPITAIHRNIDERLLEGVDETNTQEPYRIPQGAWILARDWQKVGRYYAGKQRKLPSFIYSVARTISDCEAIKRFLGECVLVSVDIETALHPAQITCIGFTGLTASGTCRSFVVPFVHQNKDSGIYWDSQDDHIQAWNIVGDILDSPVLKVMQNGFYDASYFVKYRIPIRNWLCDSMIAWYSMYMELPKSLDFISSILLDEYQYWKDDIKGVEDRDQSNVGVEKYWRYNALDCYNTLHNWLFLQKLLSASPPTQFNYNDTFMRMLSGLRMSMRGVKADFNRRHQHEIALTAERDEETNKFRFMIADGDFNINSPQQKQSLIYDLFGVRKRNAKGRYIDSAKPLKGTNAPSAGAIVLKMVKTEHPIFKWIIEQLESCMEPDKQISNVCKMYLATDRFRTAYGAAATTTTRFNSKASNFWDGGNSQNIRKEYRDWIVADDDCIFMEADYSQSDDVFVGYEANDPAKIAVIESGLDGHAVHGELFFKRAYAEIVAGKNAKDPVIVHPTKGIRQLSKRVVHGTNFQMAAITLFMTMGRDAVVAAAELLGFHDAASWPQERLVTVCSTFMAAYRKKYPRLTKKEWYAEIASALRTVGTLTNAFGITRRFLGDPSDSGTQREATGFMGQSDTAGNMNRTMYEIDHGFIPPRFRDGPNPDAAAIPIKMDLYSHGFRFMLQVHDSFLIQLSLRHPKWKEACTNLLTVMKRPVIINGHTVRIKTEQEFGTEWGYGMKESWSGDPNELDAIARRLRPHLYN